MKDLFLFLKKNDLKLSTCESFTSGLFANQFSQLAGASNYFRGSFVCYSNYFKNKILGISNRIIKKYNVVSKEFCQLMASNTQKKLKTDICFSFTGFAPFTNNKDSGLSFFCILYKKKYITVKVVNKEIQDRNEYQNFVINEALKKFKQNFL